MKIKSCSTTRNGSKPLVNALAIGVTVAYMQAAHSQTLTWGGSGATTQTSDYSSQSNWSKSTSNITPSSPGDIAIFTNAGSSSVDVSSRIAPTTWQFFSSKDFVFTGSDVNFDAVGTVPRGILIASSSSGTISIANNIQGAGVNIAVGGNTGLILSGNNTFSGTVNIFTGSTLSIVNGALPSTGVVLTLSGGTLNARESIALANSVVLTDQDGIFTQIAGTSLTLDQLASGPGGITQAGPGTLILNAANSYVGATFVNGGSLLVNGSIVDSGALNVAQGGLVGGIGTLPVTFVDGTIAPGKSSGQIGTLAVSGTLTLADTSIYQVEIGASGVSDLIRVDGAAILNGGGVNIANTNPVFTAGSTYTILTATEGVSGTFGNPVQHLPLVDLSLSYDINNVYFNVTPNQATIPSVIQPSNPSSTQVQTAAAVQSLPIVDTLRGAVLVQPTVADISSALDQLSGQTYASARSTFIEDSRFIRDAINDRLTTPVATEYLGNELYVANWIDGSFWLKGFGSWADRDEAHGAAELKRNIGGMFFGADRPVNENVIAGLSVGYSRSRIDIDDRHSTLDSDNYTLAAYSGAHFGAWRTRMGAAYTWSNIDAERDVSFTGLNDTLKSDYSADTGQIFGELGRQSDLGSLLMEPFLGLAWVNLDSDGFTEKGGAAALKVDHSSDNVTFSTLGLRASGTLAIVNDMQLSAKSMLGWRHAFGDRDPSDDVRFISGGSAFGVDGLPVAQNSAVLDAGVELAISAGVRLGVSYSGQIGDGAKDSGVNSQLSLEF